MHIQRLQWAGMLIRSRNVTAVMDPMFNSFSKQFFGQPNEPLYPLNAFGQVDVVAVTHLHSDHFDPEAIQAAWGDEVSVLVPHEAVETAKKAGLKQVRGMNVGDLAIFGHMSITAVYSADGLGDPQVAWVVEAEGKRVIHCGDTLWHGHWWEIARKYGPFDAAFLPVNGAIIENPDLAFSGQPICLTPEQAVAAASVLGVQTLVPIHYGSFHNPPAYSQTPDLIERLQASATDRNVSLRLLQHKESMWLGEEKR